MYEKEKRLWTETWTQRGMRGSISTIKIITERTVFGTLAEEQKKAGPARDGIREEVEGANPKDNYIAQTHCNRDVRMQDTQEEEP